MPLFIYYVHLLFIYYAYVHSFIKEKFEGAYHFLSITLYATDILAKK